ncbi:MAG: CheY-like chemotaxis protein [Verrucomicrobiales bacterium]|jgi:CheY-like chemotaxis protein
MKSPSTPGRILIVDDQIVDRRFLRQVLRDAGHDLMEAMDGAEALEMAAELAPDLILLDVMMPGIDGCEVCESLRDDPDTSAIPIFMITALVGPQERLRGFEAGASDFLEKPVDPMELRLRVSNVIHQQRSNRKLEGALKEFRHRDAVRDEWATYLVNELDEKLARLELDDENQQLVLHEVRGMTSTILDCRQMSHPKAKLDLRGCDLEEIVFQVSDGLEVPIARESFSGMVQGDSSLLIRLFGHLLVLSHELGADSQAPIRLTSKEQGDGHLTVEIVSRGSGIWHESFATLDRGSVVSNGFDCKDRLELNLAFCRHAIDLMGGSIGVETIPGDGIRFWFTLPLGEDSTLPNVVPFEVGEFAYAAAVNR